jgi:hypothetical protein
VAGNNEGNSISLLSISSNGQMINTPENEPIFSAMLSGMVAAGSLWAMPNLNGNLS